jgi:hypothetical protein
MAATVEIIPWRPALAAALRLYRALGFRDAPLPEDLPLVTIDVYMTFELDRA